MSVKTMQFIFLLIQMLLVVAAGSINEHIINTECHNNTDCSHFEKMENIQSATCLNHHCACKDSDDKTIQCLPQVSFSNIIGGKCPCIDIKSSNCISGFCVCNTDFKASNDNRKCLPKLVAIGSPCEDNVQCSKQTTFAECINHTCSCKSEFTLHNGASCQSLVGPGKECESDKNCSLIPNTLCVSQQCVCEPGFVVRFDKTACLPNADYNDGCLESVQCQGKLGEGAVCENGKCVCGEDFVKVSFDVVANETKSICENPIAIGQLCSYDTDCFHSRYNGTEQSMKCSGRECKCADDFEEDRDSRFCIRSKIAERENTWFDFILMKVSSTFASSSGHRNNSWHYLILIVFICSVIMFS